MRPRYSFNVWRPAPIIAVRPPAPRRATPEIRPPSALLPDVTVESGWLRFTGADLSTMPEAALDRERREIVEELDRLRLEGDRPRGFILRPVSTVDWTEQAWLETRAARIVEELARRGEDGGGHAE